MCLPCALSPFAAVLARLGLPYPALPAGALRYALGALAVYRLALLLHADDGPWRLWARLRERAGCYAYGPDGRPTRALGRLLGCPYCLGMGWATVVALGVLWPSLVGDLLLVIYGLAGAQALCEDLVRGGRDGP